jgi:capsular polysaccharide biosynthesis protein
MSVTFLLVVSLAPLPDQTPFRRYTLTSFIPLLPAHTTAVTILIAIILGLMIGLSLTYLVDYLDPCFRSPAQVIRTLRIPLVVAIPRRTP